MEKHDKLNSTPIKSNKSTWIAFAPFIYLFIFMIIGVFLVWSEVLDSASRDEGAKYWVTVLLSSIVYLVIGLLGFFSISIFTLFQLIRNKVLFLSVKRHWPLIIAIIYFFLPNLPGPIDEIIVSTIMGALATYLGLKKS